MNIRLKRKLLMKESMKLQSLKFDKKLEHKDENKSKIINKQDELYKEYKFYDGFIKAKEKIK